MAGNLTDNATTEVYSQKMSTPVVAVMRTIGLTIVVLNVTVIVILVVKKRKFPEVYWLQIICLALNDCLAGLAAFFISFIDEEVIRSSFSYCCIIVTFLYTSQSASLYNIFGISVHRYVVTKRHDTTAKRWKHRHTIISTVAAWVFSVFMCSLPVFLYSKPDLYNKIKFCSLVPIFGKDIGKSTLIMMGSFCLPLVFINVMYVILFLKLKTTWKKILPSRDCRNSEKGSLCSITAALACARKDPLQESIRETNFRSTTQPSTTSSSEAKTTGKVKRQSNNCLHITSKSPVQLLTVKKTENYIESKAVVSSGTVKQIYLPKEQNTKFENNKGKSGNQSHAIEQSSSKSVNISAVNHSLARQQKVFSLVGAILLFLNIFSWPGVIALLLTSMVNSISLNRETLLPLFTTICFNSVVNPILYTVTITEFRRALVDLCYSLLRKPRDANRPYTCFKL